MIERLQFNPDLIDKLQQCTMYNVWWRVTAQEVVFLLGGAV